MELATRLAKRSLGLNRKYHRLRFSLIERWQTSVQYRVLGTIIFASAVVLLILAMFVTNFLVGRFMAAKEEIASQEIERARVAVEEQIAATGVSSPLDVRLKTARAAIVNRAAEGQEQTVYEPVILVTQPDDSVVTAPEDYRIPERLRNFVSQGQVASQYATIQRADGSSYKALIIGTPTDAEVRGLQVYLVMSMESDEATLAMLRGAFAGAAVLLIVLFVIIVWVAMNQLIVPVRSASRIAARFADGHLRERMVVEGRDEIARLAMSFNSMADSLSKKIQQLEEYGNFQRQFTSDVSHELRTPLTTVRLAADMINADSEDFAPHTKRASQLLVQQLDLFEDLLNDLLEISRYDAGATDLSATQMDVRDCINSAWNQVRALAKELGVQVTFIPEDAPLPIVGDARRVERILRNLFANAIDHSEGNPVEIRAAMSPDAVAITVTDHGVGLKPEQEELVFERFWRADPSRERHSGGTGLGLAIAREDAHLHGGEIEAKGRLGVGSTFRLVLPRTPGGSFETAPLPLAAPESKIDGDQE